ncbi:MAG: hypothetical protein WCH86_03040 [Kiritimatiellales bacterium]
MKKVFSIIVVTTALSLSSSAVLPAGAYSYKSGLMETFDAIGTGNIAPKVNGTNVWSVFVNYQEYAQNLKVTTTDGRSSVGYNAGAVNNTDRSLAAGKSSGSYLITKFVNATGSKLTDIELYYDMECNWVSKGGGLVISSVSVEISTNGTTWVPLGAGYNAAVSNTTTTIFDRWLTDSEMNTQKLSKRNVGGLIALPAGIGSINVGHVFYIRWVTSTMNSSDKTTYGIDNLRTGTDSDNDGLSDAKEASLGTDPNKADSDGDGMSDGDEIAYGTNPLDSTSAFTLEMKSEPAPAPSNFENNTVSFPAADGKYYTLLFSESMTGTFKPVAGYVRLTGNKGQRLYAIHSTETEVGFYKVLIETN